MTKREIIREKLKIGVPYRQIADDVGVSVNYVYSTIWQQRDPEKKRVWNRRSYHRTKSQWPLNARREWTKEDSYRAKAMKREGLSFSQIARKLGRSRNSVAGHLQRAGA